MDDPKKAPPPPGAGPAVIESFRQGNRIYERRLNSCGRRNCGTCRGDRPAHGPYWYLCYSWRGRWRRIYLGKDLDTTRFVDEKGHVVPPKRRPLRADQVPPAGTVIDQPGQTVLFDGSAGCAPVLWTCTHCSLEVHQDGPGHAHLFASDRCPHCWTPAHSSLLKLPPPSPAAT